MTIFDWVTCTIILNAIIGTFISVLLGKFANIKIGVILGIPITIGLIVGGLFKLYFGIGC